MAFGDFVPPKPIVNYPCGNPGPPRTNWVIYRKVDGFQKDVAFCPNCDKAGKLCPRKTEK